MKTFEEYLKEQNQELTCPGFHFVVTSVNPLRINVSPHHKGKSFMAAVKGNEIILDPVYEPGEKAFEIWKSVKIASQNLHPKTLGEWKERLDKEAWAAIEEKFKKEK